MKSFYHTPLTSISMLVALAVPLLTITTTTTTTTSAISLSLPDFVANGVHKGEATFYDSDGRGHCSLDSSSDGVFGAMASAFWSTAAVCGVCAEISHKDKTVTVPIVDECPSCSAGSIDLSRGAFRALASESAGRIDISWKVVPCPVQGNLRYRYKPDANAQYLAVQLLNYAIPIRSLECRAANGGDSWQSLKRPAGLDFRITPYGGAPIEDKGIAFNPGQTITGKQSVGSISVTTGNDGQTRISFNTTGGNGVSATIGSNGGINIDLNGIKLPSHSGGNEESAIATNEKSAAYQLTTSMPGWLSCMIVAAYLIWIE
ncbi:RlpA-like double-psi beta-barrel-protein domain-containing protein-containing protein [Syncephalis plumigaleata]|nr:RlpA-like double-psi beta-barrel-protein domain-containing protein-containing protein [Syncephalis plumigaleata]